jgi:L-ascorbate metabolism protein UlaG (beta-lactamase superfamily)
VLFDTGDQRILTDPVLTRRLAHLERRVPEPADDVVQGVDTVLLSHVHLDHFHGPSLRRLGGSHVVAPAGSRRLVPSAASAISEVRAGDRPSSGEVTVDVVPADHSSRRGPHSRIEASPVGYVVRAAGASVYFAGDTGLFAGMAEIGPVDVALLPIWGWGHTLGEHHLDPQTAAEAAELLGAKRVIPIHWGTYSPIRLRRGAPAWLNTPREAFQDAMARRGLSDVVVDVAPGGTVDVADLGLDRGLDRGFDCGLDCGR